jgi:chloride channel protein, CIC family
MKINLSALSRLSAKLPENVRAVLLSLAAAFGAVLFMALMNWLFRFLYLQAAAPPRMQFAVLSLAFTVASSLAVSLLLKRFPAAAGSGIPQVKAAYWKDLGYIPFKEVLVKFFAGIVSIGGDASLGREGPTVFLGSGIASFLSGFTGTPTRGDRDRRVGRSCGRI